MLKTLVIKELRETAGIVVLAILAIAYALSSLTGMGLFFGQPRGIYWYPFLNDQLAFYMTLSIGGLAVALGLKQTAWEVGQGTQLFLLHRPISRNWVFTIKLAVGLVCVLTLSAAMILLYVWWTATPGHIGAPFYWSMTVPAWQQWVAIPVVYFGAFLSGMRPGRWFGSRLVPLLAAILVAVVSSLLPWWWLSLVLSSAAIAAFCISILYYVQRRDY
jgi:hypothetical protein